MERRVTVGGVNGSDLGAKSQALSRGWAVTSSANGEAAITVHWLANEQRVPLPDWSGPRPFLDIYLEPMFEIPAGGDLERDEVYSMAVHFRTHLKQDQYRLGPFHLTTQIPDVVNEFLQSLEEGDDIADRRRVSMLLEALLQALDQAERLTEELAARDEEVQALHREVVALGILVRSLKRKLTRKRLGSMARLILDFGLGVGVNFAYDSIRDVAVQPVVDQCNIILNVLGDGSVVALDQTPAPD